MQRFKLFSNSSAIAAHLVAAAVLFLLPFVVGAQEGRDAQRGLIVCGYEGNPCDFGDLITFISRLINFLLFQLAAPIAVLVVIVSGIRMVWYSDSQGELSKAKTALTNVVIGFVIAFSAWAVVTTILRVVAPNAGLEQYINR